jgi:hypothetical protein
MGQTKAIRIATTTTAPAIAMPMARPQAVCGGCGVVFDMIGSK